ncbi:MAG: tetratricopeptide repeat protein [Acidobacteriota bacterium]
MSENRDAGAALSSGGWLVFPESGALRCEDREARLTLLQMTLLLYLVENSHRVVGKEEIFRSVWRDARVEEGALPRCISELRRALGDDARRPRFIETLPKRGYRWIASVEHLGTEDPLPGAEDPLPDAEDPLPEVARSTSPRATEAPRSLPNSHRLGRPALALLALAGLALVFFIGVRRSDTVVGSPGDTTRTGRSVVVLTLADLGADPEREWLASALAELLTSELALSPHLKVVPRAAVRSLHSELGFGVDPEPSLQTLERVRAALGVEALVTGSYLSEPDRGLRLDLRLWSRDVDGGFHAVVIRGSEDELSGLVAAAGARLRPLLGTPDVVDVAAAPSAQNAELYSRALGALRRQEAGDAKELLEAALTLDDSDPLLWLALSEAWEQIGFEERARAAAEKAASLSEHLAREQQLWVEAEVFRRRREWDAAIDRFQALGLFSPGTPEYTLQLVRTLNEAGRARQALAAVPAAVTSASTSGGDGNDAPDPRWLVAVSTAQHQLGDYQAAENAASRAVESAASLGAARVLADGRQRRALSLYELGRVDDAMQALEAAESVFLEVGDRRRAAVVLGIRAGWLLNVGQFETALHTVDAGLELLRSIDDRRHEAALLRTRGRIQARTGRPAESRMSLERALALSLELANPLEMARAHSALAVLEATAGRYPEAVTGFEQALAIYRRLDDRDRIAVQLQDLGRVAMLQGDFGSAVTRLVEAEQFLADKGGERRRLRVALNLGTAWAVVGDLESADHRLREAAKGFRRVENDLLEAQALSILAEVLVDRGLLDQAARAIDESEQLYRRIGDPMRMAGARIPRVLLLLERGEHREAADLAWQVADPSSQAHGTTRVNAYRLAAEASLAVGELDFAGEALAEAAQVLAGETVSPTALARLWVPITEARYLAALGRTQEALERATTAMDSAASSDAALVRAEAEIVRRTIELGLDDPEAATRRLAQLEAEAEANGWLRLALRARGVAPPRLTESPLG